MNPTGKKFISLFLVFSLLEISCATLTSPISERKSPGEKNMEPQLSFRKKTTSKFGVS